MGRKKELEEYIKEYRQSRKIIKQKDVSESVLKLIPLYKDKLNSLINDQKEKQRGNEDRKVKFIFLCQLLSSSYTGSNEVILGMSDSMLYLDEKKSQVYWCPDFIYQNIDTDMVEVEKILRKKFIRLQEFELFYIKQKLINDDWDLLQECFCNMSEQSLNIILNSQLQLEDEVVFLCGNYMDNMKIIWRTGKENNNG